MGGRADRQDDLADVARNAHIRRRLKVDRQRRRTAARAERHQSGGDDLAPEDPDASAVRRPP